MRFRLESQSRQRLVEGYVFLAHYLHRIDRRFAIDTSLANGNLRVESRGNVQIGDILGVNKNSSEGQTGSLAVGKGFVQLGFVNHAGVQQKLAEAIGYRFF